MHLASVVIFTFSFFSSLSSWIGLEFFDRAYAVDRNELHCETCYIKTHYKYSKKKTLFLLITCYI